MTMYEHGSQMSLAMLPDDAGAQKSTQAQIAGFRAMHNPGRRDDAEEEPEAQALTHAELARLLAGLPERWCPFHELLAETGIRVSEALGLDWPDVRRSAAGCGSGASSTAGPSRGSKAAAAGATCRSRNRSRGSYGRPAPRTASDRSSRPRNGTRLSDRNLRPADREGDH